MTLIILHGEDQTKSRQTLHQYLTKAKQQNIQIKWLDGEKISRPDLEIQLNTQNLFQAETIVIENLFSRLKSSAKEACLVLIKNYSGPKDIYIWERKPIPSSIQKKFPTAKFQEFKPPFLVFKFLETVSPKTKRQALKLFHQVLNTAEASFVFILLARHLSQLIIAKTNPEKLKGANWQKQKLITQAQSWTLNQLLQVHHQLFQIDFNFKTGRSKLDLIDQLDLLLLEL